MTSRILPVVVAWFIAATSPAQELRVGLAGNGGVVEAAAVDVRQEDMRLMARTHRGRSRSVVGVDTGSLTLGPLRLSGLARLVLTSPLGLYSWSSTLTRAGGAHLDLARVPTGRFGAALRADDGYVYAMRRSATLDRFGAGGRIRHGSSLEGELAVVFSRIAAEPPSAADLTRREPREHMVHAAARLRGSGSLLRVTVIPIAMAADRLPLSGAGVVSAGLSAGWLTMDGSLALAGRGFFTGDAKRVSGATATLRMRAADDSGHSLELRSRWRADATPEQVMSARLAAGAGNTSRFTAHAEISHRRTRSAERVRVSGRAEARDGANRGWLSGSVSMAGEQAAARVEVGTRLQVASRLRVTMAAGWDGEWSARMEFLLREAGNEARLELADDGDWEIDLALGR